MLDLLGVQEPPAVLGFAVLEKSPYRHTGAFCGSSLPSPLVPACCDADR